MSYWTVANAVRPSSDSDPPSAARGSVTDVTWSSLPTLSSAASIAWRGSASVSLPDLTVKTAWAVTPDAAGNLSSSRSCALWDSVPGTAKSSAALPVCEPAATAMSTMAARRPTRPRFQRRERVRAMEARSVDIVRPPIRRRGSPRGRGREARSARGRRSGAQALRPQAQQERLVVPVLARSACSGSTARRSSGTASGCSRPTRCSPAECRPPDVGSHPPVASPVAGRATAAGRGRAGCAS